MDPVYRIEDGAILNATSHVLCGIDLAIPSHAITAVLGPSGGGKSSLLHALSGRRMPGDLRLDGTWRYQGMPRSRWPSEIHLLPQRRAGAVGGTWREALDIAAAVLLMDEPCAAKPAPELAELASRLKEEATRRTIIVATHHIAFAESIADYAVLLCGGRVDCAAPGKQFFEQPPTPMAAQLIRQGNCWPRSELPPHFKWVSGSLAGMARPGMTRELDSDLEALSAAGIELVVSLTEVALPAADLARHGLEGLHFPIPDMGVPELGPTRALCEEIRRRIGAGARVVVHCHAGLGRTGTVLASLLVHEGRTAADAIRSVRAVIRNAIQTADQEEFVSRYEHACRGAPQ